MSYSRGFSTLGCPELSLDEAFALARAHRLDCVELRALAGTIELPAYFKEKYVTPVAFAERLRASDVRVAALDTSLRLIGGSDEDREALLRFVPWAEAAGIARLRVFDGGKTGDEAELAEAAAAMAWWRELRAQNGWRVDLMVETHDSLFTAAAIGRFLALAPGAGILWDTHHTWKRGGEDPLVTWRAIRDAVVHVHVKDSVSKPSEKHPFTYVLPGDGEFPMAPLRAAFAEGFSGTVSVEWERMWHPYLAPLDDVLRAAGERAWW
jgi:sugar phosphate isomerase/epimerase